MSDMPETIWADAPEIFDGSDVWHSSSAPRRTEYTRADIANDKLQRAADLLAECAADLTEDIEGYYPEQQRLDHPTIQRKYDMDMGLVRRVEAFVADLTATQ